MRRRLALVIGIAAIVVAVPMLAGCGAEENDLDVVEGEPVALGALDYNVVISRFLNPDDVEDAQYLVGEPPPAGDQLYLAVFMQVSNEGDTPASVPRDFRVTDTQNQRYDPIPSDSDYALELGQTVAPGEKVPIPDSTAADGPIQGSMVLFKINDSTTENRPLELTIPSSTGESGTVTLDI
jgi:hypothetical protein